MAKKEVKTDLWVAEQLKSAHVKFTPQGSDVKDINEALKTASKRGTGKAGYPEYTAVVGRFVIVIEDKASLDDHIKRDKNGVIDMSTKAVTDYAVNGALFYAQHIAQNTTFNQIFALGVSGDEKHHRISPLYVNDRAGYRELEDIESFFWFSEENIEEYYTRYVLDENTDSEKTTEEMLKDAAELHEYLRTYGSLGEQEKPLVVSGALLALNEEDNGSFSVDMLIGDDMDGARDGDKVLDAIEKQLTRTRVAPQDKRDKLMHEFQFIADSEALNTVDDRLGMTPLKYFVNFLKERVFHSIKYHQSSEDLIGRFYSEFMSYSGGDGQSLGIVLTPRHICDLMRDLVDIKPDDIVLDPCCGTGGFLISAMHKMLEDAKSDSQKANIRKLQIHGIEKNSKMFALSVTNMILRGDGKANVLCTNFLAQNPSELQLKGATVGLMNPPYSQGTKDDPSQYEISFIEHLLDSLTYGGRAAVIVPQSTMTGKTKVEKEYKESILKHHTLEGVITCNTDTFYGVGTNPVIAVFTAHEPHPDEKICKFIDFRDDGYEVRAHIGLVECDSAKDKRAHLLDVWNDRIEPETKFCVKSKVKADDEWLHASFYFNDEIPTDDDFAKTIGDYLTFEFSMIMQGREYLFMKDEDEGTANEEA